MKSKTAKEQVFEGLGVSPGIAIGPAFLRESGPIKVLEYSVAARQTGKEIERFQAALKKALRQVRKLRTKAQGVHGASAEELGYLLDAHEQMLQSGRLGSGVAKLIEEKRINAEAALSQQVAEITRAFESLDDPYLRTRAKDVQEVGQRILRNLTEETFETFDHLENGSLVLAEEITPSDTALMDPRRIAGFATVLGGAESHTAIMARSLGLPAVLGVAPLLQEAHLGQQVIIDGTRGRVVLNPTAKTLQSYERLRREAARELRALSRLRDLPAVTRDGAELALYSNLELPREVKQARSVGAEGIGLLRTEFLFMNREALPDEDEQFAALKEIVEAMDGRPVTVRTLDAGGDKLVRALGPGFAEGANPALGLRAIRLGLKNEDLLRPQLRAILRAAAVGPVRILLPMISTVSEVRTVRKLVKREMTALKKAGHKLPKEAPPLGIMIEVPGAALAADALAQESDFFAIGTNDLTMYTLAIDRGEEQVAHLYNPLHPGVLRLIQFSVGAALRARIPISVCGEVAGDPRFTPLLLGLGVRELSMTASALPRVKARVRALDSQAAASRAQAIMDQTDSGRIAMLLDDFIETL